MGYLLADKSSMENIFAGRFRIDKPLKDGSSASAFLAVDTDTGNNVVIKVFPAANLSPSMRLRMEHEIQMINSSQTESVASILYRGEEKGLVYLVRPFIKGTPLNKRLESGPLEIKEVIALGISLLEALKAIHEHGVFHRNIKPSNIITYEKAGVRRNTLIDFGFAPALPVGSFVYNMAATTACYYSSPEQAGLLNQGIDERSDLYSAGIVLFECLAGRPPFYGNSIGEILRQHLTVQPTIVRTLRSDIPRALAEIIHRLLQKDPRDRYQSAFAAIIDLSDILSALNQGITDPDSIIIGINDKRATLTEPAFVGRKKELSELEAELDRACNGLGDIVVVEAESGGGKTRLLNEFAVLGARKGVWVLRGQEVDQSAHRPFQIIEGIINTVISAVQPGSLVVEDIKEKLGEHLDAACAVLPKLAKLFGAHAPNISAPETYGEIRSIKALLKLLRVLGRKDRPFVILFDDCQWADDLTRKLLSQWHQEHNSIHDESEGYTMIVVAFRSEEVHYGHSLRKLNPSLHITLMPFSKGELRAMLESMAGVIPDSVIDMAFKISAGNPFMAVSALQGMIEAGALNRAETGWEIAPHAMEGLQTSDLVGAFLAQRLERLSEDMLNLLSIGALLGKEFDLYLITTLSGESSQYVIATMDKARQHHIVWIDAEGTRYIFTHDRLRQSLLDRLSDKERKKFHSLAAERIEAADNKRIFDLAHHFDAAGEYKRAFPYALAAAEQARSRYALALAEKYYKIAERYEGDTTESGRLSSLHIVEGLGDVLMLLGKYDEAAVEFEKALLLADDRFGQARIESKRGELAFKRGDSKAARKAIERGLGLLGRPVPKSAFMAFMLCAWEIFVQILHTYLPGFFLARKKLDAAEEVLAIRLYNRLTYAYYFDHSVISLFWAHLRALNLAEQYPATTELGMSYSLHGISMIAIPYFSRALRYAEKSLAIREALGDVWGKGYSLHYYGIVLYAAARYREAIDRLSEAVKLLDRTGDRWEANNSLLNMALATYRLGELRSAAEQCKIIRNRGYDIGDKQAIGINLQILAKATGGKIPVSELQAELESSGKDLFMIQTLLQADGVRLIGEGRFREAISVFQKAFQEVKHGKLRSEYTSAIPAWLATAIRKEIEQTPVYDVRRRQELIKYARKTLKEGMNLAKYFKTHLPHILRERGFMEAMLGNFQKARKCFDESIAIAERQEAQYEYAQTLMARGQLGFNLGWEGADKDKEAAKQLLQSIEMDSHMSKDTEADKPATLSLVDRYATLLEVGRKIASSLSHTVIFKAVQEAALNLLRGERSLILGILSNEKPRTITVVAGEGDYHYNPEIIEQSLAKGQPVIFTKDLLGGSEKGIFLMRDRSVICAPIFARGVASWCLYVAHSQIAGLFGDEEERLARFIVTLAGAAIENAEGFAEAQLLSQDLEKRVEDRTAQLSTANRNLEDTLQKLRAAQEQLLRLSITDELTGLYTRRFLFEWQYKELEGMNRNTGVITCMLIDVDFFKQVNDAFGHAEGDMVLKGVANIIKDCIRESDIAGRYGGEEFLVFLPNTPHAGGLMVAERIRMSVEKNIHHPKAVTISIGVASYENQIPSLGKHVTSDIVEMLFKNADKALYRAKAEGRNRVMSAA